MNAAVSLKGWLFSLAILAGRAFSVVVRFFFSSRRRHTRCLSDWSSDVCSSDLSAKNSADTLKQKERNARLHVFAGKPALTGTASRDDARARALRGAGIQRLPDGRNRARLDYRGVAARSRFYRRRKPLAHRARTRKGRRKSPPRRRKVPPHRSLVCRRLRGEHFRGAR